MSKKQVDVLLSSDDDNDGNDDVNDNKLKINRSFASSYEKREKFKELQKAKSILGIIIFIIIVIIIVVFIFIIIIIIIIIIITNNNLQMMMITKMTLTAKKKMKMVHCCQHLLILK